MNVFLTLTPGRATICQSSSWLTAGVARPPVVPGFTPTPLRILTMATTMARCSTCRRRWRRRRRKPITTTKVRKRAVLGQFLGSSWAVLGQFLGSSWAVLGQFLGSSWAVLGQFLDSSWAVLEPQDSTSRGKLQKVWMAEGQQWQKNGGRHCFHSTDI